VELRDANSYFDLDSPTLPDIRLVWFDKVLVEAGMAESRTEAARKISVNAVQADGKRVIRPLVTIQLGSEKVVRLGKKIKRVSISE
jgi:predicted rRNA methylase YqxC with S4 and FtsJ domains